MLAIGAGLAPDDRRRRPGHGRAVARHALAVALHFELLQIGRQPPEILRIGQNGLTAEPAEIAVPDLEQPQDHWQVLRRRRFQEMPIHGGGTRQKLAELRRADGQHDGEADCRPQRIAPADPIPEPEHAPFIDTKGSHRFDIGRDSNKMSIDRRLTELFREPGARSPAIRHGLGCGEGLRGDDEERRFRVDCRQHLPEMRAIDIGDEVTVQPAGDVRP